MSWCEAVMLPTGSWKNADSSTLSVVPSIRLSSTSFGPLTLCPSARPRHFTGLLWVDRQALQQLLVAHGAPQHVHEVPAVDLAPLPASDERRSRIAPRPADARDASQQR
eukprot:scaffold84207_cov56-Phaeocystis_antarctica.AAC.2